MKVFELHYDDYEAYRTWMFSHESKTEEQFEEDVKTLLVKYGSEFIEKQKNSYVGVGIWLEYIVPKLYEIGYKKFSPHRFSLFGSIIIRQDDHELKEVIGEELFNKAIQHNKYIEDRTRKEIIKYKGKKLWAK